MTDKVQDLNKNIKNVQKSIGQMLEIKLLKQRKLIWTGKKTVVPIDPGVNTESGPKKLNLRQRLEQNKEWTEAKEKVKDEKD